MPEALAVVAVFVVTVIAWVGAWLHARDPSKHNPREELARLVQQEHWLRDRLVVAQRERWSSDMVATLDAELRQTSAAVRAKSGYSGSNKTVA